MKFDIVGIGTPGIDILHLPDRELRTYGGVPDHTIIALSRLGLKTGYIGRVGKDQAGDAIVTDFQREGVDTIRLRQDSKGTMHCHIHSTPADRTIVKTTHYHPLKEYTSQDSAYVKNARALITRARPEVLAFLHSFTLPILYLSLHDLKPGTVHSLPRTRALFANEQEAKVIPALIQSVVEEGTTVVITQGSAGCTVYSRKQQQHYEPYQVSVVDPTGAGDAFAAGWIYGDFQGWEQKSRRGLPMPWEHWRQ